MKKTIKEYLEYKETHVCKKTLLTYTSCLKVFNDYLNNKNVRDLKLSDYTDFISFLKTENRKNTTITNKINCIRGYLEYLKIMEYINFPFELVRTPKRVDYQHNVCSVESFNKIDKYLKNDIEKRAIVRLLWVTGMRIGELLSISVHDIDLVSMSGIIEVEKSHDYHAIVWDKETNELLVNIMGERALQGENKLFRVSCRTVQRWFNDLCKKLNLDKITPHAMRHGRAHYMIDQGARLNDVKNYLRHKSINSTQMYTRQNKKERMRTLREFCIV